MLSEVHSVTGSKYFKENIDDTTGQTERKAAIVVLHLPNERCNSCYYKEAFHCRLIVQ